jgi:hypothetical protein
MPAEHRLESELLEASKTVSEADVTSARELLIAYSEQVIRSLSRDQIQNAQSSARVILAYLLACQRAAGHLEGQGEMESSSNLAGALRCLEQWDPNNVPIAGQASDDLEIVERMFVEDSDDELEDPRDLSDLRLVGRFVHQAIPNKRPTHRRPLKIERTRMVKAGESSGMMVPHGWNARQSLAPGRALRLLP